MRNKLRQRRRSNVQRSSRNATSDPHAGRAVALRKPCSGVLELHPTGYGFLRSLQKNLSRRDDDVFVPQAITQKYQLREGVFIRGIAQPTPKASGPRLISIEDVDGVDPTAYSDLVGFEDRTPTNPTRWLRLDGREQPISMRVLDLLCPMGMGQRALIASPPRAGKTTLLRQIGRSVSDNYPELHLTALLVDERPEEVTDMRLQLDCEVFASSLDEDVTNHARLSRLVLNRCQRLAETGKDVFLLVDSLTRLARACNKLPNLSGAVGAGGLNIRALDAPKQLFAAARTFLEGGSLTIVATVLIETDNRMDEVIFREFKGTGNLDLLLSQQLADSRIWPAVDVLKSATRRVELLHDQDTLRAATALRRSLLNMRPTDAMKELVVKLATVRTNAEFVRMINHAID